MRRSLPVFVALASAVVVFALALIFERGLISLLGLDLRELEWISDVVLAVAFGAATFLWLHLRLARAALTRLERAQVVLETELSVAANIDFGLQFAGLHRKSSWLLKDEDSILHLIGLSDQAKLPAARDDFEYYIEASLAGGEKLRWPATAPQLNQTVVATESP